MESKLFRIRALVFLGCLFASAYIATYCVAGSLEYSEYLGGIKLGGFKVYAPWDFLKWYGVFFSVDPDAFRHGTLFIGLGLIIGAVLSQCAELILKAHQVTSPVTHGSARWATKKDMDKAGFFSTEGIQLGTFEGRTVRFNEAAHVSIIGPTRAGKGVNTVVPTCLTFKGSLIATDIKCELWNRTAHARSEFSHVLYLNPLDRKSAHYNPLLEIRRAINGGNPVADASLIAATIMTPDEASHERMTHWDRTGRDLLTAVILYTVYHEEKPTLEIVSDLFSDPSGTNLKSHLETIREAKEVEDPGVTKAIRKGAMAMLSREPKEFSHIQSTINGFLGLWSDPIVTEITSSSDFTIEDFVTAEKPLSLYLCIPPTLLQRVRPLFKLIVDQICGRLTETITSVKERRRVLFMLDEFPNLGRLEAFEERIPYMAGYNLCSCMISQDLKQLKKVYGNNHALLANSKATLFFATSDPDSQKEISNIVGKSTVVRKRETVSGKRTSFFLNNSSRTNDEIGRPLLTPDEVRTLPPGTAILAAENVPCARLIRSEYYKDRKLNALSENRIEITGEGIFPFRPPVNENSMNVWGVAREEGASAPFKLEKN